MKNLRLSRLAATWLVLTVTASACSPAATPSAQRPETPTEAPAAPRDARAEAVDEDAQYATAPPEQREPPPPAAPAPPWSFPQIHDHALDNGLQLKVVPRATLPLVQLQVVIFSGQASDGKRPGLAVLAGEMLKVGGTANWTSQQLLDKVESLGSQLEVITDRDTTMLSMHVTRDQVDTALELLAKIVQQPQFRFDEFRKLKRREIDRVRSLARSDADWAANMALFREFYASPNPQPHPYANYDATAEQLDAIGLWEVQNWYRSHFTPRNAVLIASGAVDTEAFKQLAQQTFGKWRGAAAPKLEFPALEPREGLRVILVDRPKSPQAEVALVMVGPPRTSEDFPQLKVANQILGGGVAGRLFLDVREKRSLAYSTYSHVLEVAQGPQPLMLRAGTQTAKAGLTLAALLEHAQQLATSPPSEEEAQVASRYLADVFLLRAETVEAIAAMTSRLALLKLPNDYYDKYRQQVQQTQPAAVHAVAQKHYAPGSGAIAVIAGDAKRLGAPLSHFGEVIVLDPEKDFKQTQVIAHDPEAPIELERVDGT